ncbi:hypothetical protein J7U46_16725 [Pelomonas sp. V22]|uniref:hypothetical protein n=1 Tax=Pelomonas sp. V22 TaxID=2822139 RepID=UPI0024A90182|nr:hypothetical protein [Pelomonas sp. V22]MDI4634707.1 hypothetical protein [Pelomonas sp. V22]
MSRPVRNAFLALAILVVIWAGASVLATITQLAAAADRVADGSGTYVFWSLSLLMSGLAASPWVMYFSLRRPVPRPREGDEPAIAAYRAQTLRQLQLNPRLADKPPTDFDQIPGAMDELGRLADDLALRAASNTFIGTAMMQNGRLDGLVVLASQMRLIWHVLALYNTRPTVRQVLDVYANVGTSLVISSGIEDVDFAELASPIVTAAAPSLAGAVPGLGGISRLLVNSLANGAANALLTLRVAMLTKHYCAALVQPDHRSVRRSASLAAISLLGAVTRDCGVRVAKSVASSTGEALVGAGRVATQKTVQAASGAATATAQAVAGAAVVTASKMKSTAGLVAGAAAATSDRVISGVGDAARTTAQLASSAASAVADAASGATSAMADQASAIGSTIATSTSEVSRSVAQATARAATVTAEVVGEAASSSAEKAKAAAAAAVSSTVNAGKQVGSALGSSAAAAKQGVAQLLRRDDK